MMKTLFTKTKIVCTIGPASGSPEVMKSLITAGMDVARLNFSHGTHEEQKKNLDAVRAASKSTGQPITILQDLCGPKIRIGLFSTPTIELAQGMKFYITTEQITGDAKRVSTTYEDLPTDVKKGDRILLDDGKLAFLVERVEGKNIYCRVQVGGVLSAHKGINLPGVKVSAPSLTEKDKDDMKFAFENKVDYVALSFVRRAEDIVLLRDFMRENGPKGRTIPIIAKIEKGEAIANIDDIVKESDAVMVARGDLGVELPVEEVPVLQKMIVRKCNELGKPVIVATQMLETMINNPTPTRAEASDVANAVLDGADAVMLSGETSVGKYPVQAVEMMDRILRNTEEHSSHMDMFIPDWIPSTHEYDPLCRSACLLAHYIGASTIVALTHTGLSAAHVAKFRPPARIIAVTDDEKVVRRLNLIKGIRGLIIENLKSDIEVAFKMIRARLLADGYIQPGETIITTAGLPLFEGQPTNTIKVDKV